MAYGGATAAAAAAQEAKRALIGGLLVEVDEIRIIFEAFDMFHVIVITAIKYYIESIYRL